MGHPGRPIHRASAFRRAGPAAVPLLEIVDEVLFQVPSQRLVPAAVPGVVVGRSFTRRKGAARASCGMSGMRARMRRSQRAEVLGEIRLLVGGEIEAERGLVVSMTSYKVATLPSWK